jgi:hypothetical protein
MMVYYMAMVMAAAWPVAGWCWWPQAVRGMALVYLYGRWPILILILTMWSFNGGRFWGCRPQVAGCSAASARQCLLRRRQARPRPQAAPRPRRSQVQSVRLRRRGYSRGRGRQVRVLGLSAMLHAHFPRPATAHTRQHGGAIAADSAARRASAHRMIQAEYGTTRSIISP